MVRSGMVWSGMVWFDKVVLNSPGWPPTCYIAEDGFELLISSINKALGYIPSSIKNKEKEKA